MSKQAADSSATTTNMVTGHAQLVPTRFATFATKSLSVKSFAPAANRNIAASPNRLSSTSNLNQRARVNVTIFYASLPGLTFRSCDHQGRDVIAMFRLSFD